MRFSRTASLASIFALAWPGVVLSTASHAQTTVESLRSAGVIRHGIANDSPHGFLDSSGRTVGYEVEILQHVVQKLGIPKVEFAVTTFGAFDSGR